MPGIIGPGGLFEDQPEDTPDKARISNRKLLAISCGFMAIAVAGCAAVVYHEDGQTARKLAEQEARYPQPGAGTSELVTPLQSSTFSETQPSASPSASVASPTTIPKVPFAPSATSPSKASSTPSKTPQNTSTTRRPTPSTTSKAPARTPITPAQCNTSPLQSGVATVTKACGGNMLGYNEDGSDPVALTTGMEGNFICVPGKERVPLEIGNAKVWVDPATIGNLCLR